jgi:hypothetical protein
MQNSYKCICVHLFLEKHIAPKKKQDVASQSPFLDQIQRKKAGIIKGKFFHNQIYELFLQMKGVIV